MRRRSALILLSVVLTAGLVITGYGATTTASPVSEEPTATPATTPAEGGVQVTDALGRVVEFPRLPRRIVIAGKAAWMIGHALYLFPEASERLLALENRRGLTASEFIPLLDPTFKDKPTLEQGAAPEQIAPLQPDAILLKSYMAERLGEPLERLGFRVVYVDLETPEQFFRDVTTLGQLLGNQARAQEIVDFYQARLDRIREGLAGLDEEEQPRVLAIQYDSRGQEIAFKVSPASWMQTLQVETAGGVPIWTEASEAGGWAVVNFEQIAAWNPDKVFVIVFLADTDEFVAQLKADPKWQALRAVQAQEVYGFPVDGLYGWDVPDPRWILGTTWLAQKIHPDRFAEVDVRREVYEFFGQMYGMDEATIDAQIIPQLQGDIS
jgi:iron complex transport system substrate-binding protein